MSSLLDIGGSLARARRVVGMSQRELAEALGTSQQQIARWEATGYRSARLERVAAAAAAVGAEIGASQNVAEPAVMYGNPRERGTAVTAPVQDVGQVAKRLRARGDELRDRFAFERIGVFGSFATGEQDLASDVDLLVETEAPGGIRFVEAALFVEELLGRSVDLVRPELLRDPLLSRVNAEVIYVWGA